MKLTLAITVYNRWDLLLESFANVIDDPRIDEILIMDDHSKDEYWNKIKDLPLFNPKIKVVRQLSNQGMGFNKYSAVLNSKNKWVILLDSDNVIGKDYIDACTSYSPNLDDYPQYILCPSFARPNFDYRQYADMGFTALIVKSFIKEPMFNCLMNTCNYVVNREFYLKTWRPNSEIKASDTIWHNYNHLLNGGAFSVIKGMEYFHRVHDGSGFMEEVDYNMRKAEETKKMIMAL